MTTSTFVTTSLPRQPRPTPPNTLNLTTFNEPLDARRCEQQRAATAMPSSPCDKLSQRLISPNLVQSVRCPSPVVHNVESNVLSPAQEQPKSSYDTLKNGADFAAGRSCATKSTFSSTSTSSTSVHHHHHQSLSCTTSPVLPADIRNIGAEGHQVATQSVKTPPPPPPRWAKPGFSQSQSNFTVTTTVTFNVNQTTNDVNNSQVTTPVRETFPRA